jgi:hypothetical protein
MFFSFSGVGLSPRVFAQQYKHARDWKVEVVAEAPKLLYPTAISTHRTARFFGGRRTIDMGGPADQPIDRVVLCSPGWKDHGVRDELGLRVRLQYLDGKLFVNHAPKCSVFTDRDSVGVDRVDLFDYTNPRQLLVGAITHIPRKHSLGDGSVFSTWRWATREFTTRSGRTDEKFPCRPAAFSDFVRMELRWRSTPSAHATIRTSR